MVFFGWIDRVCTASKGPALVRWATPETTENLGASPAVKEGNKIMRAVITVIGKDVVGILAKVSTECAACNVNITEVTQSVLQDMFAMIRAHFPLLQNAIWKNYALV